MNTTEFDPKDWSKDALRLIMLRAQQWNCSPFEAAGRLLDELAKNPNRKEAA